MIIRLQALLGCTERRDVAQELRVLLREETGAAAATQASREEAARVLLAGFGRPAEVAARYGSPVTRSTRPTPADSSPSR